MRPDTVRKIHAYWANYLGHVSIIYDEKGVDFIATNSDKTKYFFAHRSLLRLAGGLRLLAPELDTGEVFLKETQSSLIDNLTLRTSLRLVKNMRLKKPILSALSLALFNAIPEEARMSLFIGNSLHYLLPAPEDLALRITLFELFRAAADRDDIFKMGALLGSSPTATPFAQAPLEPASPDSVSALEHSEKPRKKFKKTPYSPTP